MSKTAERIDASARHLQRAAPVGLDANWAATKLAEAAARLAQDPALVNDLVDSTGLSEAMVRWGLQTTLDSVRVEALLEVRRRAGLFVFGQVNRARLCSVVLAGNVFTACIKAILVPLLLEVPVLVRPSSRDGVLARALAEALEPPFGDAVSIVEFDRTDDKAWDAFFRHADASHVFGGDETLRALRSKTPVSHRFVGHGHGVGVAAVLERPRTNLDEVAAALAVDVAAYDQQGCLSPQVVYVMGSRADALTHAEALHEALAAVEEHLPRGLLDPRDRVTCTRWRATVAALGDLYEGLTHAVVVADEAPVPGGPGHRHLVVRAVPTTGALRQATAPLGHHLKALGWGPDEKRPLLSEILAEGTAPYLARLGTMQTPPFDLPWDGMPLTEGLLWFAS